MGLARAPIPFVLSLSKHVPAIGAPSRERALRQAQGEPEGFVAFPFVVSMSNHALGTEGPHPDLPRKKGEEWNRAPRFRLHSPPLRGRGAGGEGPVFAHTPKRYLYSSH